MLYFSTWHWGSIGFKCAEVCTLNSHLLQIFAIICKFSRRINVSQSCPGITRVSLGFATGQFTLLPSTSLEQLPAAPRLASELRGQAGAKPKLPSSQSHTGAVAKPCQGHTRDSSLSPASNGWHWQDTANPESPACHYPQQRASQHKLVYCVLWALRPSWRKKKKKRLVRKKERGKERKKKIRGWWQGKK